MRIDLKFPTVILALLTAGLSVAQAQEPPTSIQSPLPKGDIETAIGHFDTGDYDQAAALFKPLAESGNLTAQAYLGQMYRDGLGVKQDWAEAIKWITLAADGGDVSSMVDLSYLYGIGLGVPIDREKAIYYETQAAKYDDATALNNLAYDLALEERELDRALTLVERALAQRPNEDSYLDTKGWILYKMARYEDALAPLCRAARLDGGDPTVGDHLGDALFKAGYQAEARAEWQRALQLLANEKLRSASGNDLARSEEGQNLVGQIQAKLADRPHESSPKPLGELPAECAPPTS